MGFNSGFCKEIIVLIIVFLIGFISSCSSLKKGEIDFFESIKDGELILGKYPFKKEEYYIHSEVKLNVYKDPIKNSNIIKQIERNNIVHSIGSIWNKEEKNFWYKILFDDTIGWIPLKNGFTEGKTIEEIPLKLKLKQEVQEVADELVIDQICPISSIRVYNEEYRINVSFSYHGPSLRSDFTKFEKLGFRKWKLTNEDLIIIISTNNKEVTTNIIYDKSGEFSGYNGVFEIVTCDQRRDD